MKLIDVVPAMEEELNTRDMFSAEMVNHLTYTRNFYLLEKNGNKKITSKKITLTALQNFMDLTNYEAFILDEEESINAIEKLNINTKASKPIEKIEVIEKPKSKKVKAPAPKAVEKESKKVESKSKKKSDK